MTRLKSLEYMVGWFMTMLLWARNVKGLGVACRFFAFHWSCEGNKLKPRLPSVIGTCHSMNVWGNCVQFSYGWSEYLSWCWKDFVSCWVKVPLLSGQHQQSAIAALKLSPTPSDALILRDNRVQESHGLIALVLLLEFFMTIHLESILIFYILCFRFLSI